MNRSGPNSSPRTTESLHLRLVDLRQGPERECLDLIDVSRISAWDVAQSSIAGWKFRDAGQSDSICGW